MERLIRYTEQLQLAGAYLHQKGTQHARLSLILCDNVVELLAHERCQEFLMRETSWMSAPKLSTADREAARGQKFTPKINLLLRLGDLQQEERDFSAQAHALRNECYHTAATHSEIAWRVAWQYHELACTLFGRLGQSGMIIGGPVHPSEHTSNLMERAGITGRGFPADWGGAFDSLTSLLRETKPTAASSLGQALSAAAQRRFSEMVSTIEFLAHDGLQTDNLDDAIREAYFCGTLDHDALAAGVDVQTREGFVEVLKRRETAQAAFVSPLRFARVEKWAERAKSLASESSPTLAIVKYMDLRRESTEADAILNEMGRQLDDAIQLQIDIARGK